MQISIEDEEPFISIDLFDFSNVIWHFDAYGTNSNALEIDLQITPWNILRYFKKLEIGDI